MSYILNPKTNRMIKVGGKPWRTLVKEGLIANDPITPQAVETFPTRNEIYESELLEKKTLMEEKKESGKKRSLRQKDARVKKPVQTSSVKPLKGHYVQKRTVKGVKKSVQVKKGGRQEDIADYTAQCASRTLHKHIDVLSQQLQDAYEESGEVGDLNNETLSYFENNLKNLILEEMLTGEAKKEPNRYMNTNLLNSVRDKKVGSASQNYNYETDYEVDEDLENICDENRSQYDDRKFDYSNSAEYY